VCLVRCLVRRRWIRAHLRRRFPMLRPIRPRRWARRDNTHHELISRRSRGATPSPAGDHREVDAARLVPGTDAADLGSRHPLQPRCRGGRVDEPHAAETAEHSFSDRGVKESARPRQAVNHMPGFSYDRRTKTAHFDVYVDGGKGRVRRRRRMPAQSAQDAKRLWAAFCDEVNDERKPNDTRAMTSPCSLSATSTRSARISRRRRSATMRSSCARSFSSRAALRP
jgi:hypothetical protein